jgi:hypothetical protein
MERGCGVVLTGSTLTDEDAEADPASILVCVTSERLKSGSGPIRSRWIPLAWSVVLVAFGIAYLLGWGPLVLHHLQWTTGGDLWGIFRAAHYVGWGFFGGIYSSSTGVNTFPGISLLLAPLAMVSGALDLSESVPGIMISHPTAALLLQPFELLLTCSALFAADAVAVRLAVRTSLRVWLIGVIAVVAWPVAAVWGHAEDVLAVTFALLAIRLLIDGKSRRSGWLMGIGIAFQPLVGFILPIAMGISPAGRRVKFFFQAALPSVVLIGIALASDWSDAFRALVKQPTPPALNHATPWVSFAPHIGHFSVPKTQTALRLGQLHGHFHTFTSTVNSSSLILVSGGPVRTIGLLFAVLIGLFVWRMRPDPIGIMWLCGVALALRCYFEPVMTPYYLAPPLIVALIAAARMGRLRFGIAAAVGLADTVFAYYRFSPWVWWLPVVGMLTIVLACGYPGRTHLLADGVASGDNANEDIDPPMSSELVVSVGNALDQAIPPR